MEFKLGPHKTLYESSQPWNFETDGDAEQLEHDMIEFMTHHKGIGLAAPQIGIAKQVFVMGSNNIEGFPMPFIAFNPVIVGVNGPEELAEEGCLSYPDLWLKVKRPANIIAEYQDANANTHTVEMSGLIARCFQHELDHLNGICFVDRVTPMRLQLAMKKLRKKK